MTEDESAGIFQTVTNTHLLNGLRDPENRSVWHDFVSRYHPMIVRFAIRQGMREADAEDVAQQTLIAFCAAYQQGKYEREQGRLRFWLFGIARNQIRNARKKLRRRERQPVDEMSQTGMLNRIPDDDATLERQWEEEWRQSVIRQCLEEVRREFDAKSVEAFELFAWKGRPAQEVADELGITPNAVFIAKHRIMKRIKDLLPQMEVVW
jgi:RNA polymerase sigma-70 factor (ECF subfamily)